MKETSKGFQEEHRFLSNFWPLETPLVDRGIEYATIEHFYQALKFTDDEMRRTIANHPLKGLKAFVRDFEDYYRDEHQNPEFRLRVMEYGLRHKFSDKNPNLKQKLVDTGDMMLVEYNTWNDIFWGVGLKSGIGSNHLGKLIMKIREEIINGL